MRQRRAAVAAQRQEEGLLHAGREGAADRLRRHLRRYGAGRPEAAGGGGGGSVSGREGGAAVLAALPGDGAAARGAVDVLVQSQWPKVMERNKQREREKGGEFVKRSGWLAMMRKSRWRERARERADLSSGVH